MSTSSTPISSLSSLPENDLGIIQDKPSLSRLKVNAEIESTWAVLFNTTSSLKTRMSHHQEIPPPFWVSGTKVLEMQARIHTGNGIRFESGGVPYSHMAQAIQNKSQLSYSQFPVFETRLRQLSQYMSSQKPRGVVQLWKDNRDSINYYTFWGVIIFGGLSVFLAFLSLAVSVAQTVASFRALND
jgi:hypothetical protein